MYRRSYIPCLYGTSVFMLKFQSLMRSGITESKSVITVILAACKQLPSFLSTGKQSIYIHPLYLRMCVLSITCVKKNILCCAALSLERFSHLKSLDLLGKGWSGTLGLIPRNISELAVLSQLERLVSHLHSFICVIPCMTPKTSLPAAWWLITVSELFLIKLKHRHLEIVVQRSFHGLTTREWIFPHSLHFQI